MPSIFPGVDALANNLAFSLLVPPPSAVARDAESSSSSSLLPKNRTTFLAWSAVDNVKSTIEKDWDKASHKAQEKAGKIELYSPKYYAACTFGGLLACVC